jgi:hypothetical protein
MIKPGTTPWNIKFGWWIEETWFDITRRYIPGLFKNKRRCETFKRNDQTQQAPDIAVWEAGASIWAFYGFICREYLKAYDNGTVTLENHEELDENGHLTHRHAEIALIRDFYKRWAEIDPDELYYRDDEGIKIVEYQKDFDISDLSNWNEPHDRTYIPGTPRTAFWFTGQPTAEKWIQDFTKIMWRMWD